MGGVCHKVLKYNNIYLIKNNSNSFVLVGDLRCPVSFCRGEMQPRDGTANKAGVLVWVGRYEAYTFGVAPLNGMGAGVEGA